jgi:4-amino-4-deoxy-L-arabinose transferase-like glycosyltransferase
VFDSRTLSQLNTILNHKNISFPFPIVSVVAILIMVGAFSVELLDQDETIYALVALELLSGELPYQAIFDHKPIGIYYIYAIFMGLFGKSFYAIRIMTMIMIVGTSYNLYLAVSRMGFSTPAKWAAVSTCLAFPIGLDGLAGNTENILSFLLSLIFLIIIVASSVRTKFRFLLLVAYGVIVAIGCSINYTFCFPSLFTFLSLVGVLLYSRQSLPSIALVSACIFMGFCLGNLAVYSPYLIDFLQGGSLLTEYISDQQTFLSNYGRELNKKLLIEKYFYWISPFLVVFVGGLWGIFRLKAHDKIIGAFAVGAILSSCVIQILSLNFFNHYWVMATVPVALFAAVAIETLDNVDLRNVTKYIHCFALLSFLAVGSERIINHHFDRAEAKDFHRALTYIKNTIGSGEAVVSLSLSPAFIFLSGLEINQKYIFPGHVDDLYESGALDGDQYYFELLLRLPNYVLSSDYFCKEEYRPRLSYHRTCELLRSNYKQVASFEGIRPLRIYEIF